MKLIKISIFFVFLLFFINEADANCKYQSEIDRCIEANKSTWARGIEDFICVNSNDREEIAYQIIFDLKLKEIDKEAENFLISLQNHPSYYFWADKAESYLEWLKYINDLFWRYWILRKRYESFCNPESENSIIKNYFACTKWENKYTEISKSYHFLQGSTCMSAVELKLFIYRNIAYDLFQFNKLYVLNEYRIKQLKWTREKYDKVIGAMFINLDYILRVNNQREKVTKQCQTISSDG